MVIGDAASEIIGIAESIMGIVEGCVLPAALSNIRPMFA